MDQPCLTIMADGMGGDSRGHWHIHTGPDMDRRPPVCADKPPYCVPSMDQIRALPWNGYKVATTFAGGGGSSTGYRMAGFKVIWANEIVPIARDSYAANMGEDTILDVRDIRQVEPDEILAATGLRAGELDLFDGSPPCVSFSTAGRREKNWGKVTQSHDIRQRHDDLFFEYARLLGGLQPKVFVAENVSGLIKGTAKGYFLDILAALKARGYRVEARLLDAQWLGVPQARQRLIFVGVREDIGLLPAFPKPLPYRYSVREALPWIDEAVHDTSGLFSIGNVTDRPCPTVTLNAAHYRVHRISGDVESDAWMTRYATSQEWRTLSVGGQSEK
ncbi:DNA cytosine methyltransferase [Paraburkholderia sediminicola]|uniref:DNA cytosine methyltransferase n=1 Tax=Paraburkholderia sediminicola TaxID=458836 RepID=UPI0038BDC8CC